MKKIVIIGSGVSGISAGIYGLQAGFAVDIYEMNSMAGGECTGWNRQGYHIDNCIHFLLGSNKKDNLYEMWENLNVITDNIDLYHEPYFYCMQMDNVTLHLWRDIERTRIEFLHIAPEDKCEINLFFDCVKDLECIKPPSEMSPAHMNIFQYAKMVMSMKNAARANKEYGKQTMTEFVNRFQNTYIRSMMGNYFNSNFIALTFLTSYSFYTRDSVAIPKGGSTGMIDRMLKRFMDLGGNLHTKEKAIGCSMSENKISHFEMSSGKKIIADYYIWAADPRNLFFEMLGTEYLDKNLKYMYQNPKGYVANTGYQAAFGITTDENIDLPEGSTIFPCKAYTVADEIHNFCGIRVYDYDNNLFPSNKRIIQCNILQNADNYDYWETLYQNKNEYNEEKLTIASQLMEIIERQYPQLKGKLILLGTYTPITLNKWCDAYKGGYMSFNALKGFKMKYVKSTVSGISNLFLGSQWIQNGGGLPTAATSGKFAIQQICKKEKLILNYNQKLPIL